MKKQVFVVFSILFFVVAVLSGYVFSKLLVKNEFSFLKQKIAEKEKIEMELLKKIENLTLIINDKDKEISAKEKEILKYKEEIKNKQKEILEISYEIKEIFDEKIEKIKRPIIYLVDSGANWY